MIKYYDVITREFDYSSPVLPFFLPPKSLSLERNSLVVLPVKNDFARD